MNAKRSRQIHLPVVLRVLILCGLLAANGVWASRQVRAATTWHVPGDYATIGAALSAAASGDTILVGEGTYLENLNFNSKDITLQSESGPTNTIILGQALLDPVISIGSNGKVIGFTISQVAEGYGGGMDILDSGTVVQGNIFESIHHVQGSNGVAISGMYVEAIIDGNIFRNNCDNSNIQEVIGFSGNAAQIINNLFENNSCKAIDLSSSHYASPRVINNTFIGNTIAIRAYTVLDMSEHIYRNNILYLNDIGYVVEDNRSSNLPNWDHNLVFGNGVNYSGISDQTGLNGNISVNPNLTSLFPYYLQHNSPAIDAGTNTACPAKDFRGFSRPQNATCDIGIYEGYTNMVLSISRADPDPTNDASVDFNVTFQSPVTGVDTSAPFNDFSLTSTGLSGAAITAVTGSGSAYTVTVDTGTGFGSLRLDLVDDDTILDSDSLPLGGVGSGNGNFTLGETYTIDKTAPTVLSSVRLDSNPAQHNTVRFNITFSEPMAGAEADALTLTTTGNVTGVISTVSCSESTCQVSVVRQNGLGTLRLDVPADSSITDLAGNKMANLPYLEGESYTFDKYFLFMPLVVAPKVADIFGFLYGNALPMEGQEVELRWWNGSSWSTIAGAATEIDGFFGFNGVPALAPGQMYHARYVNYADSPSVLSSWTTWDLTSYTAGSKVSLGSFDIADIELISPYSGQTVALPYTFEWKPRPYTPNDVYELDLFDYMDGDPYFYSSLLGYSGSCSLPKLPAGFNPGEYYAWDVWVYSPDGGYGVSHYANLVKFSNRGISTIGPQTFSTSGLQLHPSRPDIPELDIP